MPYQPNDLLSRHFEESGHDLISKVEEQLNLVSPNSPNTPIYRDMILTVLRMAQEDHNRWNAKITLQALRELEHASECWSSSRGDAKSLSSAPRARQWNIPCMVSPGNSAPPWRART